jgi:hypothetical protein
MSDAPRESHETIPSRMHAAAVAIRYADIAQEHYAGG